MTNVEMCRSELQSNRAANCEHCTRESAASQRLCYAGVCDESPPVRGVWFCCRRGCRSSFFRCPALLARVDRGCAVADCDFAGARAGDSANEMERDAFAPASPWQGFVLGYLCGIFWFAGTCYWIFDTMHRYGGLPVPVAALALILFCMYVGLYHGMFGLLLALVAGASAGLKAAGLKSRRRSVIRRALVAAPFLWVAVELARTRITAFPWELLGICADRKFCAHADCDPGRRLWAVV